MKAKIQLALGTCLGDKTDRQVKCDHVEQERSMGKEGVNINLLEKLNECYELAVTEATASLII